ncbi:hypothetical protein FRC12_004226 [Ceratobasidium sp. 428]|nr:hypothetical protein FRC12_004226 [Ceratobasidium sp. 428]
MPASKSHGPHSYREIERMPCHPRCERHETNKVSKRTKQNCTRRINLEERDQLTARELERASRPNHTSKEPKSLSRAEPHGSASTSTAAPLMSTSAATPLASASNVTPSIRRLNPREQMLAIVAYQLASPAGRRELKARVATLARSWGAPSNGKCLNLEGSGAGNQDVNLQKAVPGHDAVLELDSTDMGSEADVETYHEMQLDELGS